MTRPEPASRRIAAELREQITSGQLGPGALLPSEPELAADHNVGRQTARAALQLLEQEGLVTVRPRRGRIVRSRQRLKWNLSTFESPESTASATADAWGTDVENQGHDPSGESLHVEQITPTARRRRAARPRPRHRHVRRPTARPLHRRQPGDHLRRLLRSSARRGHRARRTRGHHPRGHPQGSRLRADLRRRRDHHADADAGRGRPTRHPARHARRRAPPRWLHRRGPTRPPHDLGHPRRHHRPALRRRDLIPANTARSCPTSPSWFKGALSAPLARPRLAAPLTAGAGPARRTPHPI